VTLNIGKTGANYGLIRGAGSILFVLVTIFLQNTPFLRPNTPGNIATWMMLLTFPALAVVSVFPARYMNFVRTTEKITTKDTKDTKDIKDIAGKQSLRIFLTPTFLPGFGIIMLNMVGMGAIRGFVSIYVVERVHWEAAALMWTISATAEIPFIMMSRGIVRRVGALRLMAFSTGVMAIRLCVYPLVPTPAGMVVAQCFHALTYGLFHPAAIAFISENVPAEKRALGMTLYLALGTGVPTILGQAASGLIIDTLGWTPLWFIMAVFPAMAVAIYLVYEKRKQSVLP
jgi:PPP family 3-phenylpropionic acid transporter